MAARDVRVAVGSKNPVKVEGVRAAMEKVVADLPEAAPWPKVALTVSALGFDVESDVPAQPMGDAETRQGAINRARRAFEAFEVAEGCAPNYAVGVEGGLCEDPCLADHGVGMDGLSCMAWIAVFRPDGGQWGFGRSGAFALPPALTARVRSGMELGHAHDEFFATVNSKQAGGTVGLLTRGRVSRALYMEQTMTLALVPFFCPEYYFDYND
uniref:inosine/xanthosine triphosphatase n=1 Tax=Phaeomonas parva TaxID=124430 RepID=A0A7S1XVG7_9STRA|mmetsp:Transcript_37198/g.116285  ORF Transcript_37198/g.116285 Transcript_37198/m.116285 type:complete len:212 (+) Transcript_37198:170-805(+)